MSMSPFLAGILGGAGTGMSNIAGQLAEQRKEEIRRQELEDARAQAALLQQNQLTQQQSQFEATQAAAERDKYIQPTDIAALFTQLGMKPPGGDLMGPASARIPAAALPAMLTQGAEQQKRAREQEVFAGQADVLRREGMGQPATPALPPPDEGAMYSEGTPGTPGRAARPELLTAAALLSKGGAIPPLLEKILGLDADNKPMAVPESGQLYDPRTKTFLTAPGSGTTTPPPLAAGYQRQTNYDKFGRATYADKLTEARDDFDRAAQGFVDPTTGQRFTRFEDAPPEIQAQITDKVKAFRGDIAARTGEGANMGAFAAKQNQPIGADATKFIHPQTGQSPSPNMLRSDVMNGGFMEIQHPADRAAFADLQSTKATVYQLNQMADKLITATSPAEAAVQGAKLHAGALSKSNALAATYNDTKQAFLGTLSRSLGGERGVLTNQDIARMSGALASFFDTVDVKDAKNAILQNLLDTATEAKMAAMTGQPAGEAYKQRIQDLIGRLETGGTRPPPAGANQLSRQDPLYSHARSRGMSDQQIQQKYGITLVP